MRLTVAATSACLPCTQAAIVNFPAAYDYTDGTIRYTYSHSQIALSNLLSDTTVALIKPIPGNVYYYEFSQTFNDSDTGLTGQRVSKNLYQCDGEDWVNVTSEYIGCHAVIETVWQTQVGDYEIDGDDTEAWVANFENWKRTRRYEIYQNEFPDTKKMMQVLTKQTYIHTRVQVKSENDLPLCVTLHVKRKYS